MDATRNIGQNLFGVLCDAQGEIKTVLHNRLGDKLALKVGQVFRRVLGDSSVVKLLDFLAQVDRESQVADWEMNLKMEGHEHPVYLSGFKFENEFMIIGREIASNEQFFFRELVKINNEQANAIRDINQSLRFEIGQRKEREEQLMLLNHAIETAADGIIITDAQKENVIIYCNSAFERLTGYSREEALNHNCRFLQGEDQNQDGLAVLRQAISQGKSSQSLLRNYRKDGTLFWNELAISPIKNTAGQVTHFVGVQRDVTKRVEAEGKVRELNQRLKLAAESGDIGIWEVDIKTREFIWDAKMYALFGTDPQTKEDGYEIWKRCIHPEDDARTKVEVRRALGEHKELHMQYRIVLPDDTIRHLEAHAQIVFDNHKRPQKMIGLTTDITERMRAEEDLRRIQNLESLGVLAGGIAHDFNNMLTGVMGNLSLLEMTLDENSEAYELAKEGLQAAVQTRSLTQQLLTFAKGGAPQKTSVNVKKMLLNIINLSLRGSQTKPQFSFEAGLHDVEGDMGQLSQVIQNLVINAGQAMPEGGTLNVEACNLFVTEEDELPLSPGPYVQISIIDQGIGMSEELLQKIFDPYYSTKSSGHGLGLSITHSIIQRHNGHIDVLSTPNVGSTFKVYLPAMDVSKSQEGDGQPEVVHCEGYILLVDDQEVVHKSVGQMLVYLGYEVEHVYNGEEAMGVYQAKKEDGKPFDLVITDMTMPGGMSGEKMAQELLSIDPSARIVLASGYAQGSVMSDFEKYGFVGCLSKPIDVKILSDLLNEVIAKRDT